MYPRFEWLKACQVPCGLQPGLAYMDLLFCSLLPYLVTISASECQGVMPAGELILQLLCGMRRSEHVMTSTF